MVESYYLGCPIWAHKAWVGELFSSEARPPDFLRQYASVFNAVEGNTTFYGLPAETTVARWRQATPETFRFCFKFPRDISHEGRLRGVEAETNHFFERLAPLGPRQGPFLLQLPPGFGPDELPHLASYLPALPSAYHYVVEVRHPAFFIGDSAENQLNDLLAENGVDRAIFDTRALRTADPINEEVQIAQRKKPDLPVRPLALAACPFYRFVAHPTVESNTSYLQDLAEVVAGWIKEGRTPYVFTHSPDDFYAPRLARLFHQLLEQRLPVGAMPSWPAEEEDSPLEQLSLF